MRPLPLFVILSLALAAPLHAAGGGGGGGMDMPSAGPAYDPAADYQKGVAALQAKDYAVADRAFGRVLNVQGRDAPTLYMSGSAKLGTGDLKGARKAFEKSLKYGPDNLLAQRDYAVTLVRLGETDLAKAQLAALTARVAACGAGCDAGQLTEAVAAVEAALGGAAAAPAAGAALGPAAGDRAYLAAVALINAARYPEALASLRAAHAAVGPHPDVLTYIGYTHRKLGDSVAARSWYDAALTVAPAHRGALEYYGELRVEQGDLRGARALLARLDTACAFGCAEAEELRRWVDAGRAPS